MKINVEKNAAAFIHMDECSSIFLNVYFHSLKFHLFMQCSLPFGAHTIKSICALIRAVV